MRMRSEKPRRSMIGSWLNTGSATVAELMAESGLDFVTVDMEHAEISMRFAVDYFQTRRGSHLNLSDMQALARTVRDGIVCGPGPINLL